MKAIIAFSFGRINDKPNESSRQIAKLIAIRLYDEAPGSFVVIAQWEIANALRDYGVKCDCVVQMKSKGYLSSSDVAEAAKRFLEEQEISPEVIFAAAHPDHVSRCIRCLRNAGLAHSKALTDSSIGYDQHSTEPWVRSRGRFIFRELLATPFYIWRGEYF